MARVLFEHVFKNYGDFEAVKDFNLEIRDKEFLVLVGPSGCGKSTTLRMIAGLESISDGKLHIGDRLVNDVAPKDRDIAMVFQNYALYPHMSVFDNMSFALKLRKVPKDEIRKSVQHTADILGIGHLLERKPRQLSGGQRQRVAMGRAIVRNPSVFLFDEPLSNLDAKLRVQMRVELSRLHQRLQTTMVYVTHDQVEAMTLADRIVVMKDGIKQQAGPPMELFHKPCNAFVAGFIGSPSMNFLTGKLQKRGETLFVCGEGFEVALGAKHAAALTEHNVDAVQIGVRPQDLSPAITSEATISSTVDVIEPMGSETFYYFNVGEAQLIGRSEGDAAVGAGQSATFGLNLDHLHLFSADGAQRLN